MMLLVSNLLPYLLRVKSITTVDTIHYNCGAVSRLIAEGMVILIAASM